MATRWADLTEEQKEQQRRDRKRRKYLTDIGCSPEVPAEPVIEHVRRLHDQGGMSFHDISRATGPEQPLVYPGTIADLYRGARAGKRSNEKVKRTRRDTAERLLAVPVPARPSEDACAYVPACGVRRRLQALACAGYGAMTIATYMQRDHKQVWRDMTGRRPGTRVQSGRITASLRTLYSETYDKLIHTSPVDIGATEISIGRAKGMARRYGWAPDNCWDFGLLPEDEAYTLAGAIDDPEGYPDWTGRCGTRAGYNIHRREDIETCDACRKACSQAVGESQRTRTEEKRASIKQLGKNGVLTHNEIADMVGVSVRTVGRVLRNEGQLQGS